MKKIDTLFVNAIVVTMDQEFRVFEKGALAVKAGKITDVGADDELRARYMQVDEVIDCGGKVLMPGLINVHTHVPMTLLRGLADDLRLDVWLMGYMMPVEREFVSPEFVRLGTELACAEMIRSGITCFADMYYFEDDVAHTTAAAGMRAVLGQSVLKFPSPDARSYEEGLALAEALIKKWKGHELIVPSVAPHAPYTCTDTILRECAHLAASEGIPLQIHISETAQEVENMRREVGMPVVPYVKKQDLFNAHVIAAHCVHIDEGEIRTLEHHHAGVAHNPSSNMKLASGAAPISRMLEIGVDVGIGTDGTASNNDLDMFDEIRLASFLAKLTMSDPTALPARTALLMGTRMGARVLGVEGITGSLEAGKAADCILVEMDTLHNMPRFIRGQDNIYAQLIYAAKSTDVSDVMINGRFVMRDRVLLTVDEERLKQEAQEVAIKIDAFLQAREGSVLSKLIAIGGAMEEESFEVQAKITLADRQSVLEALQKPEIEIIYERHYHEYDTYFAFEDRDQGYLRYREDHFIGDDGKVTQVRSRLTLIGPEGEEELPEKVLLSRSRFLAPASQSFRFYREYFKPLQETEVEKDRQRFLIRFHGTEFYVNIDELIVPPLGTFLEIKSRTWSRRDAEAKSLMIADLMNFLHASPVDASKAEYVRMAAERSENRLMVRNKEGVEVKEKQLRVLYIASEAAPFVKIGGLGDVAGTLPPVLARLPADEIDGCQIDIRLVIPYHPTVAQQYPFEKPFTAVLLKRRSGDLMMRVYESQLSEMPVYLIDGDLITAAETVYSFQPEEDMPKFAAFSLAALQLAKQIGFQPHIVNANDWHTAMAVFALRAMRKHDPFFRNSRSVFTVHNLPYMGAECRHILRDYRFWRKPNLSLPRWARSFCMPLGLISADHINAVSPTYAAEIQTPEFGCSLEGFLARRKDRISGIINGLDYHDWNPGIDPQVPYPFDAVQLQNRKKNKLALQKEFNLEQNEKVPLIILISRMDHQKGMDVAFAALRQVFDQPWQAVILGTGAELIENDARLMEEELPDRVRAVIRFDGKLARRMYAGGDMILLPSNYEPCGLTQLISMRYGCVPVAHATGGFVDTIVDCRKHDDGTGFLFNGNTPDHLAETLLEVFEVFKQVERWHQLQTNGMRQDFSWHRSALQYFQLYQQVRKGGWE